MMFCCWNFKDNHSFLRKHLPIKRLELLHFGLKISIGTSSFLTKENIQIGTSYHFNNVLRSCPVVNCLENLRPGKFDNYHTHDKI